MIRAGECLRPVFTVIEYAHFLKDFHLKSMSMKRLSLFIVSALLSLSSLFAQQQSGIPEDVFYLMSSFGKGTIVFSGKAPAQGSFNICALDNTIRFKDRSGQELALDDDTEVIKVVIEGVTFLKDKDAYLRVYPVSGELGIAEKRDVLIMTDSKTGGYGMESQTSSIQEYGSIYSGGQVYQLENVKSYPYRKTEVYYLVNGDTVLVPSKKNFQKCFPVHKDEIESWFKANKKAPEKLEDLMELCRKWAE